MAIDNESREILETLYRSILKHQNHITDWNIFCQRFRLTCLNGKIKVPCISVDGTIVDKPKTIKLDMKFHLFCRSLEIDNLNSIVIDTITVEYIPFLGIDKSIPVGTTTFFPMGFGQYLDIQWRYVLDLN